MEISVMKSYYTHNSEETKYWKPLPAKKYQVESHAINIPISVLYRIDSPYFPEKKIEIIVFCAIFLATGEKTTQKTSTVI